MKPSFKKSITAAALAGVTAAITNSVLFFLFHAVGVITDDVEVQDNQPLTVLPVLFSSIIPSLFAGIVYYLLSRYTKNGYRNFLILAVVLLFASFANPFVGIPGIPIGMGIALCLMHVVVVGALLYFFKKTRASELKPRLR
jgi:hypothetical protein